MAFEHRPWSVWADADALAALNPLRRVPTLMLDDGEVLIESSAILDALDEMVGPTRAMLPRSGPERRRALKSVRSRPASPTRRVSLFYEGVLHDAPSQVWIERCDAQIGDVLDALEADRAGAATAWWLGETIGHADIVAACALRFAAKPIPASSTRRAGRRWRPMPRDARRCRCSRRSVSRSP